MNTPKDINKDKTVLFYLKCEEKIAIRIFINYIPIISTFLIKVFKYFYVYILELENEALVNKVDWTVTGISIIVTIILLILYECGKAKYNYKIKYDKFLYTRYAFIYDTIKNMFDKKLNTLTSYIIKNQGYCRNNINIISKPYEQIEYLRGRIKDFIKDSIDFKNEDVILRSNIIYKFEDDPWKWFNTPEISRGVKGLDSIINNTDSTFYKMIKGRYNYCDKDERFIINGKRTGNCLFFNDKKKAHVDRNYIPDDDDISNDYMGSIFCYRMSIIYENKNIIDFIIAISSYGERFVIDNDNMKTKKMHNYLNTYFRKTFESALKTEFALMYLQKNIYRGKTEPISRKSLNS